MSLSGPKSAGSKQPQRTPAQQKEYDKQVGLIFGHDPSGEMAAKGYKWRGGLLGWKTDEQMEKLGSGTKLNG